MLINWFSILQKKLLLRVLPMLLVLLAPFAQQVQANNDAAAILSGKGKVLMVRHALAPGTGDPSNFQLNDCATQRNLNDTGRQQSIAMGNWLRSQGVNEARVFSSQWCRCKETAGLLRFGEVTDLPAINSFYQRWSEETTKMDSLKRFLSEQSLDDVLTVLVTHQVNITALTGVYPRSGTGVMLNLDGKGGFTVGPTVEFK